MRILVEEEYGYRYWLWEVEGPDVSRQNLETYFAEVVKASDDVDDEYWYCTGVPTDHFVGEWKELEWEEYKSLINGADYDGAAHIHEHHDSWIEFHEYIV